jgi:peroxiredoxin
MLAVNVGDSPSEVEQFLQNHNLSLPVLLDTKKVVAQKYSIRAIPTTFFIDKDGIIQVKVIGAFPNKAAIESRLNEIMP